MKKEEKIIWLRELLKQSIGNFSISFWESRNYMKGKIGWDFEEEEYYISYYGHSGYANTGQNGGSGNITEEKAIEILLPHFAEIQKEYQEHLRKE